MAVNKRAFMVALMATTLLTSGGAWAADQPAPAPQKTTPQQTAAEKDFGKVSADGASAFQDILHTRLAIFDGRTADAKKYVEEADTAFDKAKADDTVFTKAEADLKPPTAAIAPVSKPVDGAAHASDKTPEQMKTPITWLPVDGGITINEDYTAIRYFSAL